MTSGLEVLVQEVIAAMTTDPCSKVYYLPSNSKGAFLFKASFLIPNPLNPTLLVKQAFQSAFISDNATLSWGLLGPERQGST